MHWYLFLFWYLQTLLCLRHILRKLQHTLNLLSSELCILCQTISGKENNIPHWWYIMLVLLKSFCDYQGTATLIMYVVCTLLISFFLKLLIPRILNSSSSSSSKTHYISVNTMREMLLFILAKLIYRKKTGIELTAWRINRFSTNHTS